MPHARAVIVLALVGCGAAPPPRAQAPAPEPEPSAAARPLLVWSIESPDGRVSHVLGTLHLGVHLRDVVPAEPARALDTARVLLVEMDLANVSSPAIARATLLPPGRDLRALLPDELWPRLVEALAPSMPEQILRRLQPWAAMSILMSREAAALESEREAGDAESDEQLGMIDLEVMERAQGRGVAIQGLETVEEQVALMGSLPEDDVVEYIRQTLNGDAQEGVSLREMTDAYLRGDLEALEAIVFDPREIARSPAVFEALLYARNERWLAPLEAELAQGGAFIAVGLAHVIGERGLLALLEQHGYRVERLTAR